MKILLSIMLALLLLILFFQRDRSLDAKDHPFSTNRNSVSFQDAARELDAIQRKGGGK